MSDLGAGGHAAAVRRVGAGPGFAQAVRVGDAVHVAGQVAWRARGVAPGEVEGEGDTAAQAEQVFDNLAAVLADAGSGPADVVALTCYLTPDADFEAYARVKAARHPEAGPASTTVVVAALLDPRLLLEVAAVAIAGSSSPAGSDDEGAP